MRLLCATCEGLKSQRSIHAVTSGEAAQDRQVASTLGATAKTLESAAVAVPAVNRMEDRRTIDHSGLPELPGGLRRSLRTNESRQKNWRRAIVNQLTLNAHRAQLVAFDGQDVPARVFAIAVAVFLPLVLKEHGHCKRLRRKRQANQRH